ncbi:MAG: hypothetical protein HUJ76_00180 [Parasporobacterium sp.]|nr:hypothetical protein [Parasporobacterium sp.]
MENQYNALVMRTEEIVNSEASGYIYFFVGDCSPVYVGQTAYLIDKSGELSARLKAATQTSAVLNENDLNQIRSLLNDFRTVFSDDEYYETYHYKYQTESRILDLLNNNIFDNDTFANAGTYIRFASKNAGIAVHYTDGFEGVSSDSLESSMFRKADYSKKIIRADDYVESGSPAYKVITSEDWSLAIQISNPDSFKNLDYVNVTFLKDGISADGKFEIIAKGGKYYGIISLSKYMVRYASERYLQITFSDDKLSGLTVPKSAVTEEYYYAVPEEYLTQGGNSSAYGFAVKLRDSEGKEYVEMRYPEIVLQKDNLCYISQYSTELKSGYRIIKTDSVSEFEVGMKAPVSGVYAYNGSTSEFRIIDILGENREYYIVKENTSGGIKLYDQIYTDYQDAEKNDKR